MAIGRLTMQRLQILHCAFRFYNCTNFYQLHVKIIMPCYRLQTLYQLEYECLIVMLKRSQKYEKCNIKKLITFVLLNCLSKIQFLELPNMHFTAYLGLVNS